MDLPALLHEHHVAVAAQPRVARPFVAREDDEAAVLVVFGGELVELVPERRGDLEVVALVAHAVEERPIARKLDQLARRVGADRLLRLPVQVAPVGFQRGILGDPQGIAAANHAARRIEHVDQQVARHRDRKSSFDRSGMLAALHGESRGQAGDRHVGLERERALDLVAGVAPLVLALEAQAESLSAGSHGGQQRLPQHRGTGHDRECRLLQQLDIVIGGERIGEDPELEGRLDEGLHAHAGRALPAVAEADGERIALVEKSADHPDEQGLVPRPDVHLRVVAHVEQRTVGGPRPWC